ncbi:hypothetical protein PIB30_050649 [Stylosanthes scabra]|uniref:Polysaccharide biosynthesis domain-containing protein n=1 Tax=Stylosanthes scabra TaxID=79078 RepID=A0ABU6VKP6_9FABA|nr:hypothetical protein [Stylosanthes scabra]
MKHNRNSVPERRWFLGVAIMAMVGAAVFITVMIITSDSSFICSTEHIYGEMPRAQARAQEDYNPTTIQIKAILHYATTRIVPQQSLAEIKISFDVLKSMGRPCNFLVFGLGHDSLMWASLNPGGTTLFLEEDPKWVQTVLKDAPSLRAHTVQYRTRLKNADQLLLSYRSEPACGPVRTRLRGNVECELALHNLPDQVYETEWDLVMIDAPKGYFPDAPGRMAAVFSAAVMARGRKGSGVTHVFLHDVDRRVEKTYAEEFLCRKYLVRGVGRLWHFEIPPSNDSDSSVRFC